ncbi:carboxypeptidase-like regulatory domain-containing protein [Granulicella sp. L60]|uniref:TonB-dependent receptor n=1 Tax=Granulicella sp. L60 TaxID=1641866 RepID=UPI00131BFA5B|nr:carboxypeptidase-like regulatory domain-containing protein [Granulicella sp. L60]
MRRYLGITLFVLTALSTAIAFAQNATTSLRGVIKDPSGATVGGAKITLLNPATGETYTDTSRPSGEYQLLQLLPAKYTITVNASGFSDQSKIAELLVNQPATVNFTVSPQASNEVLNVTAEAQTLNNSDASLGNSTNNATIQALPSETRNVPDLLSLQPGVFFLPQPTNPQLQDSRSGAVNGGRSDQGNVTLDGIDDNDQVNGFAFTGVLRMTQDSVEEFRVVTGIANADSGRSSGAQVSLVTKSGTNKFHGAAYEYNRPTITVANDFFNKLGQLNSGLPNRPGKLIRNIFGADVGGPIFKDKLFFFANYEGTRRAESAEVTRTVPTATYQQGIVQYTGDTASGGTENQSISAAQLAILDQGCTVCNTPAYAPGPGVNPNALAYLNSYPAANGFSEGDGLNTGSYSFASPNPNRLNTSIVRLDYIPSSKHRIFARGNFQKDFTGNVEQFPGQGPSSVLVDNTKGMSFGDTWSVSPNIVNDIRYGYVRQGSGNTGVGSGDYVDFRFLDTPTAETRNTIVSVPVNNIIDNLTWSKGKHTIEVGGNWRLIHQNRTSNNTSFNSGSTNPYWLGGNPPDPSTLGLDPVDGGFSNSYLIAYANLVGTVPSVTNSYNYQVTSATTGTLLADGAPLERHFKANEYEWFVQDAWRPTPNLTLTFGIRHTILQTPWETKGQQVSPTIDTHDWFTGRETAALQGTISEPELQFAPSGPFYNRPGFWPKAKDNFAPRFALAYSPDNKTSIRAGFGMYYDHYGQGLVNIFSQNGSFGISSQITNAAGNTTTDTAPRFTSRNALPFSNGSAAATQVYPYSAPAGPEDGFAITWGLDNKQKTPYSESMDLSVQRELKGGWTVETAYIGRLGRHLLQSLDLAEPVDFNDPQGSGDYYSAAAQLSAAVDANGGNSAANVAAIPYFEHVFPYMAGVTTKSCPTANQSATQAIYCNEWAPYRSNLGATTALADIDFYCSYGCPAGHVSRFWQDQFASLYAQSTIGMSYYNAGQFTLRHPMTHGLQADISYTYSRSIDFGSDTERSTEFNGNPPSVAQGASSIINTWKPYLNRGVSDFDTTHILTVDWVYQLPVGHGQTFMGNSNNFVDALIGGWQLSGIFRTTSGLPFSVNEPGWTTDWQQEGYGVVTGNVKIKRHFDQNGEPQFFAGTSNATINSGVNNGTPIRLPYPGETGQRNNFRGDGFIDLDSGLNKTWGLGEYGKIKFAWEVYNVTNSMRFDVGGGNFNGQLTSGGTLGVSSMLLNPVRRMQFSLRYDF